MPTATDKFMKNQILAIICAVLLGVGVLPATGRAEHHRATHLGNPATSFAPKIESLQDLRARFGDPQLQTDIIEILRQWGWPGTPGDLFAASQTNEILECQIPVGETMPFMSSREYGVPVCLRNVTWAGAEPIPACAFTFTSKGNRYRCVTPKPCSNFFLEDLGPVPVEGLAFDCDGPDKIQVGHKVIINLKVHNTGTLPHPGLVATLALPENVTALEATEGGEVGGHAVTWRINSLDGGDAKQFSTTLRASRIGVLALDARVGSANPAGPVARTEYRTQVVGIPGLRLEESSFPDPVAVGEKATYTVKVTNQGTAEALNVQVVATLATQLSLVKCAEGKIESQTVTLPLVPKLQPKETLTYIITAQGVSAGDGRSTFTLSSDALKSPITDEIRTTVF